MNQVPQHILSPEQLAAVQGGLPWKWIATTLSFISQEAPDFVRGWRDYGNNQFTPPLPERRGKS